MVSFTKGFIKLRDPVSKIYHAIKIDVMRQHLKVKEWESFILADIHVPKGFIRSDEVFELYNNENEVLNDCDEDFALTNIDGPEDEEIDVYIGNLSADFEKELADIANQQATFMLKCIEHGISSVGDTKIELLVAFSKSTTSYEIKGRKIPVVNFYDFEERHQIRRTIMDAFRSLPKGLGIIKKKYNAVLITITRKGHPCIPPTIGTPNVMKDSWILNVSIGAARYIEFYEDPNQASKWLCHFNTAFIGYKTGL